MNVQDCWYHTLSVQEPFLEKCICSSFYDNIIHTKVIAEIWEHCDIVKKGKKQEQSHDQTGCKQTKSLARLY